MLPKVKNEGTFPNSLHKVGMAKLELKMSDSHLPKTFSKRIKAVSPKTVAGSKCQRGLGPNLLFGNH